MKTTIEISLKMASKAYDAITDNKNLEERVINEYPNIWIIEEESYEKAENLLIEMVYQLASFEIGKEEYTIKIEKEKYTLQI